MGSRETQDLQSSRSSLSLLSFLENTGTQRFVLHPVFLKLSIEYSESCCLLFKQACLSKQVFVALLFSILCFNSWDFGYSIIKFCFCMELYRNYVFKVLFRIPNWEMLLEKPCCSFLVFYGAYFRALLLSISEKFKGKCKAVFSVRERKITSLCFCSIMVMT